jgi:outer membrane protein OmpA-like peptidoglycan-associated protein
MKTMHQKTLVFAMILLTIALSGCKKSQKRSSTPRNNKNQTEQIGDVAMPLAQNDSTMISLFDEDIEAFVLQEETENPFMQDSMTVAQNDLDISWEEPTHLKDEIKVVHFSYDSSKPLENEKLALEDLTKKAQEIYKNDRMVCVKGHSCKYHGTDAYNVALSMKRASTIKENLVQAGIPESHLKVFGVGNEEPVAFDDSLDGQAPNRRVEMYALAA